MLSRTGSTHEFNKIAFMILNKYLDITKEGIENDRLYRIGYVPIRSHVKAKAKPFLSEYDKYIYQRTQRRKY